MSRSEILVSLPVPTCVTSAYAHEVRYDVGTDSLTSETSRMTDSDLAADGTTRFRA